MKRLYEEKCQQNYYIIISHLKNSQNLFYGNANDFPLYTSIQSGRIIPRQTVKMVEKAVCSCSLRGVEDGNPLFGTPASTNKQTV